MASTGASADTDMAVEPTTIDGATPMNAPAVTAIAIATGAADLAVAGSNNGGMTGEGDGVVSPTPSQKAAKLKDTDFAPYDSRPVLDGESVIEIPHMFDSAAPVMRRAVSNHWLQFKLNARYLGSLSDNTAFVYYDAQDPQFYYMTVPQPRMTLWLLIKNCTFYNGGYVKRRLVEEAIQLGIQMRLVNPNRVDLLVNSSGLTELTYNGEAIALPDAVIPRVGANVDYFGLAVMRQLESLGVKVFNPSASIEISRDKLYTHQVLAAAGIPIPKSVLSRWPFDYNYIEQQFNYPVILKLTSGSKGDAVWKVDDRQSLITLMETLDTSKPIIFQEFLADTKGRDLRCFVVGDTVVAAMMRIAATGFKANVHQGGSVANVAVGPVLQSLAVDTAKLCLLDCSGVDILLDSQSYKICEVNSSPGFQGLEKASQVNVGIKVVQLAERYVLERRTQGKASRRQSVVDTVVRVVVPVSEQHRTLGVRTSPQPSASSESTAA